MERYATTGSVTGYAKPADPPGEAPDSPSRIRDGITAAEQFQSEIHEHIGLLEKRLETVLRPNPPATLAGAAGKTGPVCSHVAGRMDLLNEGLHGVVLRLRELRERVEV